MSVELLLITPTFTGAVSRDGFYSSRQVLRAQEIYKRSGDINTDGGEGARCVPTAALSPSVSDYGKGGITTKQPVRGFSSLQSDESSGARPTSGVVTWLREAASKMC